MSERDCINCLFFEKREQLEHMTHITYGICRRHAPHPKMSKGDINNEEHIDHITWWPTVIDGDWCGEFHPARK